MTNLTEQEVWVGSLGQQKVYLHWSDVKDICTNAVSEAYEQAKEENTKLKERNDGLNNRDINLCRIANGIRDENFTLKSLLKECREHLITYKRDDLDKGYVVYDGSYLIDKISQVLGEK